MNSNEVWRRVVDCKRFQEQIQFYLDGELTEEERRTLEQHLQSCSSCGEEFNLMKKVCSSLEELPEFEPSQKFNESVLEALGYGPKVLRRKFLLPFLFPRPSYALPRILLVPAMFFISLALSFWIFNLGVFFRQFVIKELFFGFFSLWGRLADLIAITEALVKPGVVLSRVVLTLLEATNLPAFLGAILLTFLLTVFFVKSFTFRIEGRTKNVYLIG